MGRWLQGATPTETGLLIPGRPHRGTAAVVLTPAGLLVSSLGAAASLPWDDVDAGPSVDAWTIGRPTGWRIGPCAIGQNGEVGIALHLGPAAHDRLSPVLATLPTFRNRLNHWASGLPASLPIVPLRSRSTTGFPPGAERQTFAALVNLLHERPGARDRLDRAAATEQLAADLARCRLASGPEPRGVRRATTEVLVALRSCGYRHHIDGRPVAGDALPSLEDVTDDVLARLAASPYAKGVRVGRKQVERLVRKHYLDVEPWPFGALVR